LSTVFRSAPILPMLTSANDSPAGVAGFAIFTSFLFIARQAV
jgi:hypothetical protein